MSGPDHQQPSEWWADDDIEDPLFDPWEDDGEEAEADGPGVSVWRRPLVVAVAIVTALALASVPIYNVVFAGRVADNGLEVCGFDYCIVQETVREAGLDATMSALAHTFLDEREARQLANQITDHLGVDPVGLAVVARLEGRLGGVYDPATRSIAIESPARAWTVLHEVAHAVQTGHGDVFQEVVVELTAWAATTLP